MTRLVQRSLTLLFFVAPLVVVGCSGSSNNSTDATPKSPDGPAVDLPNLPPPDASPDVAPLAHLDGPVVTPDTSVDNPSSIAVDLGPGLTPDAAVDSPASAVDVGPVLAVEAGVVDVPAGSDSPAITPDAGKDIQSVSSDGPLVTPDATTSDATCVPVCTGKHCGDSDGCGGTCSGTCSNGLSCCNNACVALGSDLNSCGTCGNACVTGTTCVSGACTPDCTPSCTGKACGSDGCGGLCGPACSGANPVCLQGACQACVPSCTGAACGDPDGCGGRCQGTCAGTCSTTGYCSTCTPTCTGKACGDPDGCGGKCATGSCKGGGTCGADGSCGATCKPNCAGKTCGNNGCGGTCGNCLWPEICADTSVVSSTTKGVWTCIDQSLGCSVGTRSGYLDTGKYSDIAGCQWEPSGSIATSGDLRKARTGKWCGAVYYGLDFGECDAPEDACSPGWHICGRNGAPKDLTDRIVLADCLSSSEANGDGFEAALSPIDTTQNTCCPATKPATLACPNDTVYSASVCSNGSNLLGYASPVACGSGADSSNSCSDFTGWVGAVPVDTSNSCGNVSSALSSYGGVLCCKDPAKTGN
jgi:hypothetical protein